VGDFKFFNMNIFLCVYMILMFPMIIGVTNELKKQNIVMNGFLPNFFLFLNCIVTLPMWYFLTIKEFFQKRKK
jgi:hypothetical protein